VITVLAFDTGGTVIDWHRGVSTALARIGTAHQIDEDWEEIARIHRRRSMEMMLGSVEPDFNIDDVHLRVLQALLAERGISGITEDEHRSVVHAWHQLDAWPDASAGLARLRQRYVVVPLTILSTALVVDISRRNRLVWDCIISCEMLRVYKPLPQAYLGATQLLAIPPEQVMMVACHNFDLMAAREVGFRTAFVHRPNEWGGAAPPDPVPNPVHDVVADDFNDLADKLDAPPS
jgi:2-haloacid dehalogenase